MFLANLLSGVQWVKGHVPLQHISGRMHVPIFSGKGGTFILGICLGKISQESKGKGVFFVKTNWFPLPEIRASFYMGVW